MTEKFFLQNIIKSIKQTNSSKKDETLWSPYNGRRNNMFTNWTDSSVKDGITKIHKMDGSSQEGDNIIKSNKGTSLLRSPIKWTIHPRRMKYSKVHEKDKLFKSLNRNDSSENDKKSLSPCNGRIHQRKMKCYQVHKINGIIQVRMDGFKPIQWMDPSKQIIVYKMDIKAC